MQHIQKLTSILLLTASAFIIAGCESSPTDLSVNTSVIIERPNIVLIMTDDQGYGDIGRNNNPIINTPAIDALANQSARLTNFHVDPTCSPTRSSLLTGKHSLKAGVWHTILGRYMLGPEHETMAEILQDNGYRTAIFGKWHLGDNYPYRPQDQGFDQTFIHGGGGVGQTPDYWGNTQFNDTYYRDGVPEKTKGYATTVWFNEAIKFINKERNQPFFSYISLNAPHGPYRAPEDFIKPYIDQGLNRTMASFYGMITHIDGQVDRIRKHLAATKQLDNTIFIFMTDNGSSYRQTNDQLELTQQHLALQDSNPSWKPNDDMRGYKGSVYDGGHRVPIYISYPNGNITPKDHNQLTAHFDILPTLLSLAGIKYNTTQLDGKSLAKLFIYGEDKSLIDRSIVVTNQRVFHPSEKRPTVVATQQWRLITDNNNTELYDITADPSQQNNVVKQFPEITKLLLAKKDTWWQESQAVGFKDRYISVGNVAENPVRLNAMDWMEVPDKQPVPWFIGHQPAADEYDYVHWLTEEEKYQSLPWFIDVEQAGTYQISPYYHDIPAATPVMKKLCVIEANGKRHVAKIHGRSSHCIADVQLDKGQQKITAWFTDDIDNLTSEKAAFYLYLNNKNLANAK